MAVLKVCSVSELKYNKSQVNFIITRKLMNPISNAIHFPELSPSLELFYALKNSEGEEFKNNLNVFKRNLKQPSYQAVISLIHEEFLSKGISVTLSCYCKDPETCHRKLVAEEFSSRGSKVEIK